MDVEGILDEILELYQEGDYQEALEKINELRSHVESLDKKQTEKFNG